MHSEEIKEWIWAKIMELKIGQKDKAISWLEYLYSNIEKQNKK